MDNKSRKQKLHPRQRISERVERALIAASVVEEVFIEEVIIGVERTGPSELLVRTIHKDDLIKWNTEHQHNRPPRYFSVKVSEVL
jgi:hypothetical protein